MEKQTICLNGKLREGDLVVAAPSSDYNALIGRVTGIYYVGTPEHDEMTENATDDVLVDFSNDYTDRRISEIEEQFRDLYEDEEKTFDELPIDSVVMAPSELLRIDVEKVGNKYFESLLSSEARASEWCFSELLNFTNSQPKGTVYEVSVSYRLNGEEFYKEFEFNSECSAYESACEEYVGVLEKFDGIPGAYRSAGEFCDSLFFTGGIKSDAEVKDCFAVRLSRHRWVKIENKKED